MFLLCKMFYLISNCIITQQIILKRTFLDFPENNLFLTFLKHFIV